jgi:hypothetical protein
VRGVHSCQQMDHEAAHELYQTLKAYDSSAKTKQVREMLLACMLRGRKASLPGLRMSTYHLITCRVWASPQRIMRTDMRSDGASTCQLCRAP